MPPEVISHQHTAENVHYSVPGVYLEETSPRGVPGFPTGMPAFLGFSQPTAVTKALGTGKPFQVYVLTRWKQFGELIGEAAPWSFLAHSVRGFFDNGGTRCLVVGLPYGESASEPPDPIRWAIGKALELLEPRNDLDLICFPDLVLAGEQTVTMQRQVLEHCRRVSGRFAILDSRRSLTAPGDGARSAKAQDLDSVVSHWQDLRHAGAEDQSTEAHLGALYFPWIRMQEHADGWVPPSGHVAGIYARTDAQSGVYRAPANQILQGVVDLELHLSDGDQSRFADVGVNCLRVLPGRGIRVWSARTLSSLPDLRHINVRRLFLTLVRWIDATFQDLVFEPYTPALWNQIRERLIVFCYELFEAGALQGGLPDQAFYVKCDGELNPIEERALGRVIAEVGLAPLLPAEFIAVRISHSAAGTTLQAQQGSTRKGDR